MFRAVKQKCFHGAVIRQGLTEGVGVTDRRGEREREREREERKE